MSAHLRHMDGDAHERALEARDRLAEHGSVPPERIVRRCVHCGAIAPAGQFEQVCSENGLVGPHSFREVVR